MSGQEPKKKEGNVWTYEDAKTRIVINRKWCKGCEICVEFCPKCTLAMEGEKAVVAALETCSRCFLCETRCPDFAIEVFDLAPAKQRAGKDLPHGEAAGLVGDLEVPHAADLEGPDMCYRGGTSNNDDADDSAATKEKGNKSKKG